MRGVARLLTDEECGPDYDGHDGDGPDHEHRTAFLISRGQALTAAHNVVGLDPDGLWLRFQMSSQPQRYRYVRTSGVTLDTESDLALLQLDLRQVRGLEDSGRPSRSRVRRSAVAPLPVARRATPTWGHARTHGYPLQGDRRRSDPRGVAMRGQVRGSTALPSGFPALDCWFDGLAAGRPVSPVGFSGAPIMQRVCGVGSWVAVGVVSETRLDDEEGYAAGGGVRAADLRAAAAQVPGLDDAIARGRAERSRLPKLWASGFFTLLMAFLVTSLLVPSTAPPEVVTAPSTANPASTVPTAICDPASLPSHVDPTPSPLGPQFVYSVSSQQNSRPLTIGPGGWVMQPFVATTPFVTGMSVVPSVSSGRTERLLYEIGRPAASDPVWRSEAIVDDTNKDGPVAGVMPRAVPVEVGTVYLMRVTNVSDDPVAIYVHLPDDGDAVPYYRTACQRPSASSAPQSVPRGMVLSGAIHGRDVP